MLLSLLSKRDLSSWESMICWGGPRTAAADPLFNCKSEWFYMDVEGLFVVVGATMLYWLEMFSISFSSNESSRFILKFNLRDLLIILFQKFKLLDL